ncbi:MAG: hypothetical protein H0U60_05195 [Blastocatellia bacterium]|nr:hypothetical protein [Blastocatellia bacterium]
MSEELRTTSSDGLMTANRQEVVAVDDTSRVDDDLITADRGEVAAAQLRVVDNRSKNRAVVSYWVLPFLFLTVALLGGLRVGSDDHAFIFFPPPLIALILAVLLMLLFVRGGLIELRAWIAGNNPPLTNVSHIWVLLTLFFASAQAFNSVLPERGLLHWLFSFFFLWTLWNNQFSSFDARRLLRSLVVLFGTAFILKHLLLASLYAPDGGWLKRAAGLFAQGVTLGALDAPAFAPATGYISFFTLGLYIAGLMLMSVNQQTVNSKR